MGAEKDRQRPAVTVIVPNWNGQALLEACLEALRRQTLPPTEVILVDNGSTDGSIELVKTRYPEVQILPYPQNRGFSVAVNAGIRRAKGAYVALLNNDTRVDPGWLQASVEALESNREFGVCAPKMLNYFSPAYIDAIGVGCIAGAFGYSIGAFELDQGQYDAPIEVFGACAGAAVYRREVFELVGEFDEEFFAYYEDVDWDFRARATGVRCLYVPSAVVYHMRGGSIPEERQAWRLRLAARNRWYVIFKNLPARLILAALPKIAAYEALWAIQLARRGQMRPYLRGILDAIAGLPAMLRKRRQIQRGRRVSMRELRHSIALAERMVLESLARRPLSPLARRLLRLARLLG